MKLGDMSLRAIVRLWVIGVVVFSSWGVVLVLLLNWAERTWPSDDRRIITEAELRPDRAHFRPLEGFLPPAARTGITYVPVYSTVYLGERKVKAGMAVTLSIRNTSSDRELLVHQVDYYDTAGKLVMRLADRPHAIPTMGTAEFFIDRQDPVGGPGANYVVAWSVPNDGIDPVIEALMIGRLSNTSISFVSRGSVISRGGVSEAQAGK